MGSLPSPFATFSLLLLSHTPSLPLSLCLTSALAALLVVVQDPALIAGALDAEFVLLAALAAFEVLGAEALDLARLVVAAQFHAQRARAQDAFAGRNCAVVATAAVKELAQV